jgi:hypothetical protein
MPQISLVFSSHRPETLAFSAPLMERHDTIFLEEPPTPGFQSLLHGTLAIEDYLLTVDMEFPEFARKTCVLLQQLHRKGKKIYQVEPFLEVLAGIHDTFADGGAPSDLPEDSIQYTVYQAEKKATGALLEYYQTVLRGSFEVTVETVKKFARADAARLLLRDSLRAKALARKMVKHPSAYVEAGYIHYSLWVKLARALDSGSRPKPIFLMAPVVKPLLGKRQVLGPGDRLTLLYLFHPQIRGVHVDLLAAQSLVFIKLLEKEEIQEGNHPYPHTQDEVNALRMTESLSLDDCKRLFSDIRLAKTQEARAIVHAYLYGQKKEGGLKQ